MVYVRKPFLFLDMDGPLVDFATPAEAILGRKLGMDITKEEWELIEAVPNFWLDLPPQHDFMKLWENTYPLDPYILTAPGGSNDVKKLKCAIQKKQWCEKNLPGFVSGRFVTCRSVEKQHYATTQGHPNILIDDYDRNINQWRFKGGHGILWKSAKQSLDELTMIL